MFPVLRHFQLKWELDRYIDEIKAKGELMELSEVVLPPVPPEHNSEPLFSKAASLASTNWDVLGSNPPPAMKMVVPGKAVVGWQLSSICDGGATNSWEDIGEALKTESAGLELLRQMPNNSLLDFKLDYRQGFTKMKFSPLASIKRAAQRLAAASALHLHMRETTAAVKDLEAMLVLVRGLAHDQVVISELVRMAVAQMTIASTWEVLQATNVDDASLQRFQACWEQTTFRKSCENALLLERSVCLLEAQKMRDSDLEEYLGMMDKIGSNGLSVVKIDRSIFARIKIRCKAFAWHYWWSYSDELLYLKGMQHLLNASRTVETNDDWLKVGQKTQGQIDALNIYSEELSFFFEDPAKSDFHFIISSSVPMLAKVFNKTMKAEAARRIAITAIALKRYQLKHDVYPEKLSDLVPQFLASIPLDPADGRALRYRLNADGFFTLYSVGENGKDDGGNPAFVEGKQSKSFQWQNSNTLDWVWPQPATKAEMHQYFEDQAAKSN